MADFNPYHKWLGIPLDEQPVSYYRLLGIGEFESDADVIETAAERQTLLLRTFQTGPNSELAERLLNEVSEARVCLLIPADKAKYDQVMRARRESSSEDDPLAFTTEERAPVAWTPSADQQPRRQKGKKPIWQEPWVLTTAGAGIVALLLLVMLLNSGDKKSKPADGPRGTSIANVDEKPTATNQETEKVQKTELQRQAQEAKEDQSPAVPQDVAEEVLVSRFETLTGHEKAVTALAFSRDGKRIASGSDDHTLKVWDVATGQLVSTLQAHSNWVRSVAFSPDAKRIVSGGWDNKVILWDLASQERISRPGHPKGVKTLAFSPDGKQIASGGWDGKIKLWDSETVELQQTITADSVNVLTAIFSPDGTRIASGGHDALKLWDVATGQELIVFKEASAPVWCVAFSPDGKRIVSGSKDGAVVVWDAQTNRKILTLKGHSDRVAEVAYSPDGQRIISGGIDKMVKEWDAQTGQELLILQGELPLVNCMAFSLDGKQIVSGSGKIVRIWKLNEPAAGTKSLVVTLMRQGQKYYQEKKYDLAIAEYTKVIRMKPDHSVAYYGLGTAHQDKGELDKALAAYNEAIRLKPGRSNHYYGRGVVYMRKMEYARALEAYSEAIHLRPENSNAYYGRGRAYQELGDQAKAKSDFAKAKELEAK